MEAKLCYFRCRFRCRLKHIEHLELGFDYVPTFELGTWSLELGTWNLELHNEHRTAFALMRTCVMLGAVLVAA